ncbi:MAG: hydroxymethylbilane synthase [Flavobacteriales bacterium]|jgi:hydroxymethylbilane synthase|tara:strand:+ start:1008 stop:1928 length:921 start_codon:yes stop_codon:yes gene_type:complete
MIRIGTRKSKLALWQAYKVQEELKALGQASELILIESEGDIVLDTPLPLMGGKGVFTKALDDALVAGKIDIAVHSHKDIPTDLPEGIELCTVMERANPFDVLVVRKDTEFLNIEDYAGLIATSSNRRRSQWLDRYEKHSTCDIRGNVQTRIKKLRESNWDGAIFAAAGLQRLELDHEIAMVLDWMVPAPGQGAVAVVCREGDTATAAICSGFHHEETAFCTGIERDFLNRLNGGCSAPIGAYAKVEEGILKLQTIVMDPNAEIKIEVNLEKDAMLAHNLGIEAAEYALERGAKDIIDKLPKEKRLH